MEQAKSNDEGLRVVVVGAGIVGASIAFHLSLRGVRLTMVEAGQPASGASGISFAWLNSFGKDPVHYHDLNCRSMGMWDRFARRLQEDVGLHWGGQLQWVSTPKEADVLRRRVKQLQARGYASRLISVEEMHQLEPGLSPGPVAAAAYNANDGHVNAAKVVHACLRGVQSRGGKMHAETTVSGLRLRQSRGHASRVRAVQTKKGEIECDVVVLAAGVGTTPIAATVGIDVPQKKSPGVVIRTDPRPRVLHAVSVLYPPSIDEWHSEIHLRQDADGKLLIGEGTQESSARDDSQEHADDLLARAIHYLPGLVGAKAIPVPVGYRPMPLDGLPVLGFTEAVPNLYMAVMHSGVTLAPLVGELSAVEILDGARVELLDPYRPERFARS